MMDYNKLADLLFPNVTELPADVEAKFPARQLPEGAKVTRLAPSPTGFMHFGTLFPALVNERLAHQSGGVFYLRIEDTDAKREVEGAEFDLINTLAYYKMNFDEGVALEGDKGIYGPYHQSKRAQFYHVFAKQLVREGRAYPCFTTKEELEALNTVDKKAENKAKDWEAEAEAAKAAMLEQRNITIEAVEKNLAEGNPFVLRILSDGDGEKKVFCTDLVKGKLEMPENDEDFVLLKSDGIPTYHFAHAVDDHLMGTTHVIRGDEWLASLPKHLQLFRYLGFKAPKYMHIAPLMKMEGTSKKKLSKRDMGAAVSDYKTMGYPPETVIEYVLTLLNSNFEDWRRANPAADWTEFPFNIKKMSVSGALFDFDKLNDVSKNVISKMSADQVYEGVLEWAECENSDFAAELKNDADFAKRIFSIGRGGNKPRKDLTTWADAPSYMGFFYDSMFAMIDQYPENFDRDDIKTALEKFCDAYSEEDTQQQWFDKIKAIAEELGFASDMKAYKADPTAFKGNVGDISMFLRVAVTGKMNSPDMFEVMNILGKDRVIARINKVIEVL